LSSARSQRVRRTPGAEQDYYQLLGVSYSATFEEITRAYREKMKRAHPDRQRPDQRREAEERAKQLNLAFTTLSKADSRRAYDEKIKIAAVQEQIMGRYVGGFAPGGGGADPFGEALRRERSHAERADLRKADRSATASILLSFGAIALLIVLLLVAWSAVSALVAAVF
jgi:molecular chaperone DnaJ